MCVRRAETKGGRGGISEQKEIFGRNGWGGWRYWWWQMLSQHDFSESVVGAVIGGRARWPCLTSAVTLARVRIRLFVCGRIPRACAKGCWKRMFLLASAGWRRGGATVRITNILGCLGVSFNLCN